MEIVSEVFESMIIKIEKWDQCIAADVSGAKLTFSFIPSGLGKVAKVHCSNCNRDNGYY
ncbi:hypothetical protein [Paenibacillus sp. FSL H7-0331]|uniref:hypothetical protein n=1 Tax=Paenibacillus sp. FSL H7-0331 TaxID=1920421 RepID=UPI0015C3D500|nr:hypothetical protein [Paenibacillus sp. FSL H7-0331]